MTDADSPSERSDDHAPEDDTPAETPGDIEGPSLTPPPRMSPQRTVAWGLVGTLTFLVLHQGYLLAGGQFLGFAPVVAVAVVVGVVVGVTARRLAARASGNGQR